jgi:hypothetical protein
LLTLAFLAGAGVSAGADRDLEVEPLAAVVPAFAGADVVFFAAAMS